MKSSSDAGSSSRTRLLDRRCCLRHDLTRGARAMYLAGTPYRIHGSNEPDTIGQAVSSGCIRMTNQDAIDLYERARVGAQAVVSR